MIRRAHGRWFAHWVGSTRETGVFRRMENVSATIAVGQTVATDLDAGTRREWLETNGLGSFAMGTVAGPATRRYHALLCVAVRPPLARMVLVNRCEEAVLLDGVSHPLQSNFYPGTVYPDGYRALQGFRLDPWPTWVYRVGGALVERQLFMPHERQMVVLSWRLLEAGRARLMVRPLVSGRDSHALQVANPILHPDATVQEGLVMVAPYASVPPVFVHHNGVYVHRPDWYYRFVYPAERERGLDHEEDLFSPGELSFDLTADTPSVVVFSAECAEVPDVVGLRAAERTRRRALAAGFADPFSARLAVAADQFVARRGEHQTIVAGYPWFSDWGRDTFISLGGLALARRRHALARELLLAFAPHVREGLVPNFFPDAGQEPQYNSVDAPLWFILAASRYARAASAEAVVERELGPALRQIVDCYLSGTRFGIGVDDDGLIHAGAPGLQLTWMDAKVGDWVVTPRQGKPVEIQALWVAALEAMARLYAERDASYARELGERAAWARSSFEAAFWEESLGYLYDVIDGPRRDGTLRPNQLYALGLCRPLIGQRRAERALATCERELLTRVGLRTRARGPGYQGRMVGDQQARDAAYHEGTVWPYLLGIYADACLRVRGRLPDGFMDGLRHHLFGEGLGTLPEAFDGDAPHTPRGCPAQAWSVAEALRVVTGQVGEDS